MAGAGLNFSISNNAEMFLKMGDLAKAAEMAEKGIVSAERAALRAEKKLGAVDPKIREYVRKLENIQTQANAGLGVQRAQDDRLHEAHVTEQVGKRFDRVFGGSFMQKLIRGEKIDFTDGLREIRGFDKLAEKAMHAAGMNAAVLGPLGMLLTVGTEAVEAVKRAVEEINKDKKTSDLIGRQYGSGLISKNEFEFYQDRLMLTGGSRAKEDLKAIQEISDNFNILSGDQLDSAIAKFRKAAPQANQRLANLIAGPGGGVDEESAFLKLTGQSMKDKIDVAFEQKKAQLGTDLTTETQKEVIRDIIVGELRGQNKGQVDALVEAIQEAEQKAADDEKVKHRQKALFEVYAEYRKKQMYEVANSVFDKRVPPMPSD